jgi:superfamily II DNA or RNA helicase
MPLRNYQVGAVKNTYGSLKQHTATMLQMPTGSGKTHVAMEIIKHGLRHDRRVMFGVDRLTLLDQTLDKFYEEGIPFGVTQGDHPMTNPSAPVQIASMQTLQRRGKKSWPHFDLAIIDEAHTNYNIIGEMITTWSLLKYIGLSATPFTRGLGLIWNDLVVATTTGQLIEEGYLSDYDAYGPSTPDLTGVRRSGSDYSAPDLEERMMDLTGDITAHYLSMANGMKGLYFTPTVAFAQHMAQQFKHQGIDAEYVCGHDSEERRKDVMDRYATGQIKVVFNCEVLTKGFDQPDIMVGGLCRPTRSLSLHIQMLGRFLRTHPTKDKALILDHAGNIERLGYPDDPLPTTLDMGEPGENSDTRDRDEPTPWNCPKCHHLCPAGTIECMICGYTRQRQEREVTVLDGVLQKLEGRTRMSGKELKQDVYSQLCGIAEARGYAAGWVAHKYRELFEVWPRGVQWSVKPASEELKRWITHKQIAYAKRREGHHDHS